MRLYVCWDTTAKHPVIGDHPCGIAYQALDDAGYDPEVKRAYGWAKLPGPQPDLRPPRRPRADRQRRGSRSWSSTTARYVAGTEQIVALGRGEPGRHAPAEPLTKAWRAGADRRARDLRRRADRDRRLDGDRGGDPGRGRCAARWSWTLRGRRPRRGDRDRLVGGPAARPRPDGADRAWLVAAVAARRLRGAAAGGPRARAGRCAPAALGRPRGRLDPVRRRGPLRRPRHGLQRRHVPAPVRRRLARRPDRPAPEPVRAGLPARPARARRRRRRGDRRARRPPSAASRSPSRCSLALDGARRPAATLSRLRATVVAAAHRGSPTSPPPTSRRGPSRSSSRRPSCSASRSGSAIWRRPRSRAAAACWRCCRRPCSRPAPSTPTAGRASPGSAGRVGLWALVELVRRRAERRGRRPRAALPAPGVGAWSLLVVIAAPEIDRIVDFGGSVGTVSERAPRPTLPAAATAGSVGRAGDAAGRSRGDRPRERPEFDNDLGNLFGQISPLEVFGIWPSGDFRVEPGRRRGPGVRLLPRRRARGGRRSRSGVAGAWRRAETALLAALAAAAAIWLAARVGSTPYTTAKALQMVAPVAMLISARGLLDPVAPSRCAAAAGGARRRAGGCVRRRRRRSRARWRSPTPRSVPTSTAAGVRKLSDRFAGEPTLLLAPAEVVADQHGERVLRLGAARRGPGRGRSLRAELRRRPAGRDHPVLVVDGEQEPPFAGLKRIGSSNRVVLWRVLDGGQ